MDYTERVRSLQELIDDAEQRMKRAVEEYQYFKAVLDRYLADFGSEAISQRGADTAAASDIVELLTGKSPRQMLKIWADRHDGRIIVKELVGAAFATGRFENRTKAHRTLWSAITQARKRGEYVRVSEGVLEQAPSDPPRLLQGVTDSGSPDRLPFPWLTAKVGGLKTKEGEPIE